jgi:hypothetical protein
VAAGGLRLLWEGPPLPPSPLPAHLPRLPHSTCILLSLPPYTSLTPSPPPAPSLLYLQMSFFAEELGLAAKAPVGIDLHGVACRLHAGLYSSTGQCPPCPHCTHACMHAFRLTFGRACVLLPYSMSTRGTPFPFPSSRLATPSSCDPCGPCMHACMQVPYSKRWPQTSAPRAASGAGPSPRATTPSSGGSTLFSHPYLHPLS